jgi:hypothetical protein
VVTAATPELVFDEPLLDEFAAALPLDEPAPVPPLDAPPDELPLDEPELDEPVFVDVPAAVESVAATALRWAAADRAGS